MTTNPFNEQPKAVWRPGWPATATARIRFPDGVAFYNGAGVHGGWVGLNMDGEFLNSHNNFKKRPGIFDALFVADCVHSLEGALKIIKSRYGNSRPAVEFKAQEES